MSSSKGFTFLDEAFDMPASSYTAPAPMHAVSGGMYGAPQSQGGGGGQAAVPTKQQQQQQQHQQEQLFLAQTILQELGSYMNVKDRESRDHQEQLFSSYVAKQTQNTDNALHVIKNYCSSLEILQFIIISALVILIIIQLVICHKLSNLASPLR